MEFWVLAFFFFFCLLYSLTLVLFNRDFHIVTFSLIFFCSFANLGLHASFSKGKLRCVCVREDGGFGGKDLLKEEE